MESMQANGARRARLAAAVLLALGAISTSFDASAKSLAATVPAGWKPGDGTSVAALFHAMKAVSAQRRPQGVVATVRAVTSCADDKTAGTLRSVISGANDGDTIDLSTLTCSTITLQHGAIPLYFYSLTVQGRGADKTVIDGNSADRVFVHYGTYDLTLRNLTVRNGSNVVAGDYVAGGACILSNGYTVLDHAAVENCTSIGEGAYGGGILSRGITLYTSTLSGNVAKGSNLPTLTASYGGGGFAYFGTAALYDSTVTNNRAIPDPANTNGSYDTGAGIFADNGGYASRSTISGNYTDGTGGGFASHGGFIAADSTISGNTAKKKPGGGIFTRMSFGVELVSSTVANNTAPTGAGIYLVGAAGAVTLQSTIVANNSGGDVAAQYALTVKGANNLVTSSSRVTLPADTLAVDPRLQPLSNNGGPTLTHALSSGSPAIDAGNNAFSLPTDQRGLARDVGKAPDIGAFEFGAAATVATIPVPTLSSKSLIALIGIFAALAWRRSKRRPP